MSIANTAKPTTSVTNTAKVSFGETWATITTTWAGETRTWLDTISLIDNISKPYLNLITNSGFDDGVTGWDTFAGSVVSGVYNLVQDDTLFQTLTLTPGAVYTFSFDVSIIDSSDTGDPVTGGLDLHIFLYNDTPIIANYVSGHYSFSFTAGSPATWTGVGFLLSDNGNDIIGLDNIGISSGGIINTSKP